MTMGAVGRVAHQMKSACSGQLAGSAGRGTGAGSYIGMTAHGACPDGGEFRLF